MSSFVAVRSSWVAVGGGTTIEKITEAEDFARLRWEWGELLEKSDANCLFLTWEWLSTWWKHLGAGRRLCLITVRRGNELIAIAPLAVSPPRLTQLVPFRSLEFLGVGSVGSDYLDVIVRRGREEEALDALVLDLVDRELGVALGQVHWRSGAATVLAARLARRGWECLPRQSDVCPFIPLGGISWPAYLASLDVPHRSNFNRRFKNLGKTFDVRFERAVSDTERREALQALFTLHHLRWRERGGSTAFYQPALLAFHEEWSRVALERGWLRLLLLKLDGRPVAALYGLSYRGTFYFYQTGFDPGYARYGVGQVIVGLAIKSAIEEGATEFDFLHGAERYKFDWAREVRELGRIELYPPTLRGRLHRRMAALGRRASRMARQVLPPAIVDRITTGGKVGIR